MLTACSDGAARLQIDCSPLARAQSGFGSAGQNRYSHGQVLCPGLLAVQNASCATLSSPETVAELVSGIAREPLCCRIGWAGLSQGALELATLLVRLGHILHTPRTEALRFVAMHAGNGWLALVVSVYLQRIHGGALHGLLVGDGKSEWSHAGDVRTLMRQVGLSYRMTAKFEAMPELALLSVDPKPNRLIMPISFTPARAVLPRRWEGSNIPPFGACIRVGSPLEVNDLTADFGRLAPYCHTFSFWAGPARSGGGERSASNVGLHLEAFKHAGAQLAEAHRAGNWTILSARPSGDRLHFANDYIDPPPPPPPPPKPPKPPKPPPPPPRPPVRG